MGVAISQRIASRSIFEAVSAHAVSVGVCGAGGLFGQGEGGGGRGGVCYWPRDTLIFIFYFLSSSLCVRMSVRSRI